MLLRLLRKAEIGLENKSMFKWSHMSDSFGCGRIWSRKMNTVMKTHANSMSVLNSCICNMFLLSATHLLEFGTRNVM